MNRREKTIIAITGLLAGFASAALGIGGGVIIMPVLLLMLKYDYAKAVGISLAAISMSVLVGIISHYLINSQSIHGVKALVMAAGSIAGARAGAYLVQKLSSTMLKRMLAVLLILISLKLTGIADMPLAQIRHGFMYPGLVLLGFFAGLSSALFGIGGGVIMVPFLTVFFAVPIHDAVPTSLTVILPTTMAGAFFHRNYNSIDLRAVKFIVPGSLLGTAAGALASNMLSPELLKGVFGVFLVLISMRIFIERRGG